MSAIVVCGEALMDVFALADTPTGLSLEARIGGSPFNVAVGLARLARPVAFFGSVSRLLGTTGVSLSSDRDNRAAEWKSHSFSQ
jgi:hypothetical protein